LVAGVSVFRRSRALVGLDIGSSAVKVVEMKLAGKGFRVSAFGMRPVPPDSDDLGQTGTGSKLFTIVGSGVTASFTSLPTAPSTATTVQFNGVASTASGGATITEWKWYFGDGTETTASVATTMHVFDTAGTYVVRLTVTDSEGRTGTVTANVTVT